MGRGSIKSPVKPVGRSQAVLSILSSQTPAGRNGHSSGYNSGVSPANSQGSLTHDSPGYASDQSSEGHPGLREPGSIGRLGGGKESVNVGETGGKGAAGGGSFPHQAERKPGPPSRERSSPEPRPSSQQSYDSSDSRRSCGQGKSTRQKLEPQPCLKCGRPGECMPHWIGHCHKQVDTLCSVII